MGQREEMTVTEVMNESRALIARNIGRIRDWMTTQSIADIKDQALSASQRANARRVFNRTMHIGPLEEQATDMELETYFIEANILREVVPQPVASVQRSIEEAARTIVNIQIYKELLAHGATEKDTAAPATFLEKHPEYRYIASA